MKKLMLFLAVAFLLVGVVSAEDNRTLYDTYGIYVPFGEAVAGSTFDAYFSFGYLNDFSNPDNSPLIIQLNFSSYNESYPVWRNDFEVSGYIEKYTWWGLLTKTIEFECDNSETQLIEHPLDAQVVYADNGTFYCYNEEGDLRLDEYSDVFLQVTPNHAIYPGEYDLIASMFYLTDERGPFVNISNKNVFEKYYRENDNVLVLATIDDVSGIGEKWATVTLAGTEIFPVNYDHFENDEYYFSRNTPVDIVEDDYELFVFAEDNYGNRGNDSVILKIDRTAPEIVLVQPNSNSVYGENDSFVIEVGASDAKAGLDNESVEYRISEIVNGSFCPDSGVIFGDYDCYNSGWVSDWSEGDFVTEINISGSDFVSGSYWLETRACDILGNCGVL